ncbi:MAG: LolA family protein, partial [Bryobacteraceae bacterium]
HYNIKLTGEEAINGQKAFKLELIPKSAQRLERLKKLELWIAESGTHPIQQKFTQPSGDYTLITYSNVKLNPALSEEAIELKLPKGVKREYPQR